jgi:hypothetical protein
MYDLVEVQITQQFSLEYRPIHGLHLVLENIITHTKCLRCTHYEIVASVREYVCLYIPFFRLRKTKYISMKFPTPIGVYWANLALFHYRSKKYLSCRKIEFQFYEKRKLMAQIIFT